MASSLLSCAPCAASDSADPVPLQIVTTIFPEYDWVKNILGGCCAQGIEFEPGDEYNYPDDYPETDSEVTVTGVFDTYVEKGCAYNTLRNAEISF